MNPPEISLPFFDASARRVRLPQPTSNCAHFHPQPDGAFSSQKSFKPRRTASHTRTPSWGSASSSSSESHSHRTTSTSLLRGYHQCFTPESSRSPSPMTQMSSQPMNIGTPIRRPRSP
ncbi:hypothetical protein RSAG8_12721, partial [Rhizoctonia solani AG-8 WAC10335]